VSVSIKVFFFEGLFFVVYWLKIVQIAPPFMFSEFCRNCPRVLMEDLGRLMNVIRKDGHSIAVYPGKGFSGR
jgi:hypothetical protein